MPFFQDQMKLWTKFLCSAEVQTMYYYPSEGFPFVVKTQRVWKKQHFFLVHDLFVYFFTIINTKILDSFWCEKAVIYTSFGNANSIKENQFRFSYSICGEKIENDIQRKKKGTKTCSVPNLI